MPEDFYYWVITKKVIALMYPHTPSMIIKFIMKSDEQCVVLKNLTSDILQMNDSPNDPKRSSNFMTINLPYICTLLNEAPKTRGQLFQQYHPMSSSFPDIQDFASFPID